MTWKMSHYTIFKKDLYAVYEVQPEQLGSYLRHLQAKQDYRKSEHLFNKFSDNHQHDGKELTHDGFKLLPSIFWRQPNI